MRKIIARDEPAALDAFLLASDWELAWERGDGMIVAALEAQAPRCALHLIKTAPLEDLARPDRQGQTPLFYILPQTGEDGDGLLRALLARAPGALLERDGNERGVLERAARARSWPQLQVLCPLAAALPLADRLRAVRPVAGEPELLTLAIRYGADSVTLGLILDVVGELKNNDVLQALREAAWSDRAEAIDLLGARLSGRALLRQVGEAFAQEQKPRFQIIVGASDDQDGDEEDLAAKAAPSQAPAAVQIAAAPSAANLGVAPKNAAEDAFDALEPLAQLGQDFDPEALKKRHPFLLACFRGHEAAARSLLALGFDGKATDEMGRNALHAAIWARNLPLMRLALEAGANARQADHYGFTPLLLCATRFCEPAPLRILRARRVLLNGHTLRGQSALELACWAGTLAGVQWLLRRGAPATRLTGSSMGPLEAALRSKIDPVAKAEALLRSTSILFCVADSDRFLAFKGALGFSRPSAMGEPPVDWSAPAATEATRISDAKSPQARNEPVGRLLTLCAAVMGTHAALEWVLAQHQKKPVFSHFDFLAAWLRALAHGKRTALTRIEDAWREWSLAHPDATDRLSEEACCKKASETFLKHAYGLDPLEWTPEKPPAQMLAGVQLGAYALPTGCAQMPAPWVAWAGQTFLQAKASAARARVASRVNWGALDFWSPSAHDAQAQLAFFCLHSRSSQLVAPLRDVFNRAGRAELRGHLAAALASAYPIASLWLFLRAVAEADRGEGKKSRILAAAEAIRALRKQRRGSAQWANELPSALVEESMRFEARLGPVARLAWTERRREGARHEATLSEPRVFGDGPWETACRFMNGDWMELLSGLGLPAYADSSAFFSARLCADAWRKKRNEATDAAERHEADRQLTHAFEIIARNPVAQASFSQADSSGRGPLFYCFVADAWEIALRNGAQTTRQAAGPVFHVLDTAPPRRGAPATEPSTALSALLGGASLDKLPALAFRAASDAVSPWGAPLLGMREQDGQLPFAVALRGANLPQEAQRRIASLWAPTLAHAAPDAREQSLLLSRAAGCGLHAVADALFAAGARLPSGGAPLVCSIARLKSAANRELLAPPRSSNHSTLQTLSPEAWESSRLHVMVQWARGHGLDPFEPLPQHGQFDTGAAEALPGFDPLSLAIVNGHGGLAQALLLAGSPARNRIKIGALPQRLLLETEHSRNPMAKKLLASVGTPSEIELDALGLLCLFPSTGSHDEKEWVAFAEALGAAGAKLGQTFERDGSFGIADFLSHRPSLKAQMERLALSAIVSENARPSAEAISAPKARARRI